MIPDGNKKCTLFVALNNLPDLKTDLSKVEIMWNLDHYFRHLYRIFKYIDGRIWLADVRIVHSQWHKHTKAA